MPRPIKDLLKYVRGKIKINDNGCWIWQGSKALNGYGIIGIRKHRQNVHRFMYEYWNGKIDTTKRLCVCHKCDTPACCNPDHLFLGTDGDNIRDSYDKGRMRMGLAHNWGRIPDDVILAIKNDPRKQCIIAKEHGVSNCYVSEIKSGRKRKRLCQSQT